MRLDLALLAVGAVALAGVAALVIARAPAPAQATGACAEWARVPEVSRPGTLRFELSQRPGSTFDRSCAEGQLEFMARELARACPEEQRFTSLGEFVEHWARMACP